MILFSPYWGFVIGPRYRITGKVLGFRLPRLSFPRVECAMSSPGFGLGASGVESAIGGFGL